MSAKSCRNLNDKKMTKNDNFVVNMKTAKNKTIYLMLMERNDHILQF